MSLIGKFILTHWKHNDGFESKYLRRITRENKHYYVSDVQRSPRNWKEKPHKYRFNYQWAEKFRRDDSELGFRRSVGKYHNTDGTYDMKVVVPSELVGSGIASEVFGIIKLYPKETNSWDTPILNYLEELFKKPVFYTWLGFGFEEENIKRKELKQTGTLFQITHFGGDKKYISFDENYNNRTILYWLFEDCLVIYHEEGKDTW